MRSFEVVDARILVEVDCEVPPGGSQSRFILVHYDITISGGECTITAPTPAH